MSAPFEITGITKTGGPLTKRIFIDDDGRLKSDGSECRMSRGQATRLPLAGMADLAEVIDGLEPKQALTLGRLRPGLGEKAAIVTKGKANPDGGLPIARSEEHFVYAAGEPGLALLDFDMKGMPPAVAARIEELGGFEATIASILPNISTTARLTRASTSAGLYRTDTGEKFLSSGGLHVYVHIRDGADAERFLKTLHARLVLVGFGWMMIGRAGQLLERSPVDRSVAGPERLVFEGPPVLEEPVAQDAAARSPVVIDGETLDTVAACPPQTIVEQAEYRAALAKMASVVAPESATARTRFTKEQAEHIAQRAGISLEHATRVVERQCGGVLLPQVELVFDDPDLAGATVADVLADPDRYTGETLADPLEGVGYGRGKAKVMRRADGSMWINSFAHGRTTYELKEGFDAIAAALDKASQQDAPDLFVRLVLKADLTAAEIDGLRAIVVGKGIRARALDLMLKNARAEAASAAAQQRREQRLADRQDPRKLFNAPAVDAEWLPIMAILNDVMGRSTADLPPMRNRNGGLAQVATATAPSLHLLTSDGSTQIEAPPQMQIAALSETEAAELVERYVEFEQQTGDGGSRSVHLASSFVKHFMTRRDGALPIVTGVSTLPIVLSDGQILTGHGLDRRSGIVFRIPAGLSLPSPNECDSSAVAAAMSFLCDNWLTDVSTDYAGACVTVACALTIIERMVLTERPAFWFTAGQRGGGKTTTLHMVSAAVLGMRAAAAAWSPSEEERRKSLFAYLGAGLPLLIWDNIALGAAISCSSIERALTAETYSDRVLGENKHLEVPANTVQAFTGNNISAKGDLASRSLAVRLSVDRVDPENRTFVHADPVEWTLQHRGEILRALFVILLGNPRLWSANNDPAETRFKGWWHIVGSAVEHAAEQHRLIFGGASKRPAEAISFKDLFIDGEADDEQALSTAAVLDVLQRRFFSDAFQASDVASLILSGADLSSIDLKGALETAANKALPTVSSVAVSWRLKAIKDRPVKVGGHTLALRFMPDKRDGGYFSIRAV